RVAARAGEAGGVDQEIDLARLHRVSGGRQTLQVAEAASAHAIQHDAGAIPRQMGPAAGLSDGRSELCCGAFAACQGNGTGPAAPKAQQVTGPRAHESGRLDSSRLMSAFDSNCAANSANFVNDITCPTGDR